MIGIVSSIGITIGGIRGGLRVVLSIPTFSHLFPFYPPFCNILPKMALFCNILLKMALFCNILPKMAAFLCVSGLEFFKNAYFLVYLPNSAYFRSLFV